MNKNSLFSNHRLSLGMLFFISLNSAYAENIIIAGSYYDNKFEFPLMFTSQDKGETWVNAMSSSVPSLPSNFINGSIQQASCSGMNCVVTGFRTGSGEGKDNFSPLIASSADGGLHWSYANIGPDNLPLDFHHGYFSKVICKKEQCVAAGHYVKYAPDSTFKNIPWVASSINGGADWSFPVDSGKPNFPNGMKNGVFTTVNCSDSFCLAAGSYNSTLPLIARSKNGGRSWAYSLPKSKPDWPVGLKSGGFSGSACAGSYCVVVGGFTNEKMNTFPLIAYSLNGKKWTYTLNNKIPKLPSDFQTGSFTAASCAETNCVAVGSYDTKPKKEDKFNNNTYPLLALSADQGSHWSYAVDGLKPSLPTDLFRGAFFNVNCSGAICLAVGSYHTDKGVLYPLVAQSPDNGKTWKYVISSSTTIAPKGSDLVRLSQAQCSGDSCVILGSYWLDGKNFPLIVKSNDAGLTWTYLTSSDMPVPADYAGGALGTIGISQTQATQ